MGRKLPIRNLSEPTAGYNSNIVQVELLCLIVIVTLVMLKCMELMFNNLVQSNNTSPYKSHLGQRKVPIMGM